ncbi:hypothetical protein HK096_000522, partial [Nowakowskiella sp. JEL0078]
LCVNVCAVRLSAWLLLGRRAGCLCVERLALDWLCWHFSMLHFRNTIIRTLMASKFLVSSIISLSLVLVGKTLAEWLIVAYKTSKASKNTLLKIRDAHSVATMDDLPGLAGYPFIGSFLDMMPYLMRFRIDQFLVDSNTKFGSLIKMKLGGLNSLIIGDAAIAKKIANLPDHFQRGNFFRDIIFDISPHALFVIPSGEQWKK